MPVLSESAVRMLNAYDEALSNHLAAADRLTGDARRTYRVARQHLDHARHVVQDTHQRAADILNDLMIPPQARGKLIADTVAQAREQVTQAIDQAQAAGMVLQAQLRHQVLPKPPGDRRDLADAERRLLTLLDRTPAAVLDGMLLKLSARADAVAGVLHSQYGRDLAELAGVTPEFLNHMDMQAIEAAMTSTDPDRRSGAEAYFEVGKLAGVSGALNMAIDHVAEDATTAGTEQARAADIAAHRGAYLAGVQAGQGGDDAA